MCVLSISVRLGVSFNTRTLVHKVEFRVLSVRKITPTSIRTCKK